MFGSSIESKRLTFKQSSNVSVQSHIDYKSVKCLIYKKSDSYIWCLIFFYWNIVYFLSYDPRALVCYCSWDSHHSQIKKMLLLVNDFKSKTFPSP